MGLITVKTFDNLIEAHMLKSKLESEEIVCYLFDENVVGINPLYNITVGGIKLKVNEFDLSQVREIFLQIDNTPITNDNNEVVVCPSCDGTDLISGFKSMKGSKGILSIITAFLFMAFPLYYKTVYKCEQCDFEFRKKN